MTGTSDFAVEVMAPAACGAPERAAWERLRAANPMLWSPYFDPRFTQVCARHAPDAALAVIHRRGTIIGFLPFQGRPGGLARPLGAPLSDQHGIIAAAHDMPDLARVCDLARIPVFPFTGLVTAPVSGAGLEADVVWIADTRPSGEGWRAWQAREHKDHARKMARRLRKAVQDFGPLTVTSGETSQPLMQQLAVWKGAKYRITGRHDIMGVGWIRRFLDDLLASPDPDFGGELAVLRFGDRPAAIEFGMRGGKVLHSWFPAYDEAYASASPGVALMEGMIESAGARGFARVDLGAGHAHYKKYCAQPSLTVFRGRVEGAGLRAGLSRMAGRVGQALEKSGRGQLAALPGMVSRRLDQILAAEPTTLGRLRGLVWAATSFGAGRRAAG
jgi:CelD/BcsL family acetyltransferase involved in cellulose biosynthesis